MKTILGIDIETYSPIPLTKVGVYRYVDTDEFEILLFSYAYDDGPVQTVDLARGEKLPERVLTDLENPDVIKVTYNAQFERVCLSKYLGHWLDPHQWRCTAVMAAYLTMPSRLADAAVALAVTEQKMEEGKELIRFFSMPCKPTKANGERTRNLPEHAPDKWAVYKQYNAQDVETERAVRKACEAHPLPESEWELYALDQIINDRGVRMGFVDSALKRIEAYKSPGFMDFAWLDGLFGKDTRLSTLDTSMQMDFSPAKIAELSTYVAEVVAAIKQGEEVKTEDVENLQTILTLISELDTLGIGGNVVEGIAQGMTEGGWDSDAETVVANLEAALNAALDSHSPAQRMVPMGENVSAGIGQGAGEYDFSGDAETVAEALEGALNTALQAAFSDASTLEDSDAGKSIGSGIAEGLASGVLAYDFSSVASTVAGSIGSAFGNIMNATLLVQYGMDTMGGLATAMSGYSFSAVGSSIGAEVKSSISGSLNASTLRGAGVNVMSGLAAGIRAGRSGVVSAIREAARAAVSAAKAELKIASPSAVFRDEVGAMAMKGFGVGALQETQTQARVLRNAARYLTEAAQEGATGTGASVQSTRNYNQNSTVNLNVGELHVRDKQDVHALAVEIASLTRTEQRGRGLRGT